MPVEKERVAQIMYLRKIVTQGVRCFATEAKHKHIENMVKKSKVVVFMKGVPDGKNNILGCK